MTLVAFLLRQRRFVGRCGLIAVYLANRQTVGGAESLTTTATMGGCCRYLCSAIRDSLADIRDVALRMGSCLTRCCVRFCVCSDCLPSAEAVGRCLYGVLLFAFVTVGCPVFVTWIICRAICLWRRRRRGDCGEPIAEDADGSKRQGYNTFENPETPDHGSQGGDDDDYDDDQQIEPEIRNYMFYTNQLKSEPRGDYIDEILTKWRGNYHLLENHHGFIQWLFPLYEGGVNYHAQILNIDERERIIEDAAAYRRILESYKLMLDFYGITLLDEDTGEVTRSENYRERFNNLNRHAHNFLRISRIIKCLEIFNYSHLAMHLVKFFITEIVREGNLSACHDSCMRFWIPALGEQAADEMRRYVKTLEKEKAERVRVEKIKAEAPVVGNLIGPGFDEAEEKEENEEEEERRDISEMDIT